jgi:histidinol-phosphatase (PHP family)
MPALIDVTIDGHVHTRLCNHASGEMEEYVQQGVQRGLATIVFLEHLEAGIHYHPRSWLEDEFVYYFEEGRRLQQRYRGIIDIRLGVETGYNPAAVSLLQEKLALYPWDRIGLSCHFHRHGDSHLNLLSRRRESLEQLAAIGVNQVISDYFNALIEAIGVIDCDVICHLDAVLRHYPGIEFNEDHRRQIETLLDGIRSKGVALEINTSGIAYRGSPFPAPWIIKGALQRGIPLFAGSDAHQPEEVGRYFDRLPEYLQDLQD